MWRSKLGQEYEKSYMDKHEKMFKADLDKMRKQPENRKCADCAADGTVWASINLGVFLCIRCGSIHRGLGTHVSIPKGCTGTYLWGPDELESMRCKGNQLARDVYGGEEDRPSPDAGDEAWKKYIKDKYVDKKFAPSPLSSLSSLSTSNKTFHKDANIQAQPFPTPVSEMASTTEDLICFDFVDANTGTDVAISSSDEHNKKHASDPLDFFSDFGL